MLRPAGGGVDAPSLGRGRNQQRATNRTGLAQGRPERADGARKAGRLRVENRVGIEGVIGRSMLEPHLIEADLQLLRQQHGERRVDALPHLHHRHHQRHRTLSIDADESVGGEGGRCRVRRQAGAQQRRQGDVEDKATAERGANLEDVAAIEPGHQGAVGHD